MVRRAWCLTHESWATPGLLAVAPPRAAENSRATPYLEFAPELRRLRATADHGTSVEPGVQVIPRPGPCAPSPPARQDTRLHRRGFGAEARTRTKQMSRNPSLNGPAASRAHPPRKDQGRLLATATSHSSGLRASTPPSAGPPSAKKRWTAGRSRSRARAAKPGAQSTSAWGSLFKMWDTDGLRLPSAYVGTWMSEPRLRLPAALPGGLESTAEDVA